MWRGSWGKKLWLRWRSGWDLALVVGIGWSVLMVLAAKALGVDRAPSDLAERLGIRVAVDGKRPTGFLEAENRVAMLVLNPLAFCLLPLFVGQVHKAVESLDNLYHTTPSCQEPISIVYQRRLTIALRRWILPFAIAIPVL